MERLSAYQRSKIRRLSQPKELAPDEEGGELNIVPFLDIITNVMMFVLATITVTFTATIDSFPPRAGGSSARPPTTPTLGLTILVVPEGFSVKARGGNVAPGCDDVAPGLAVGKTGNEYDFAKLTACVQKLKASSPDFKDETSVTISGNPNIPYQTIISTIDAVRSVPDPSGKDLELFPDVSFGVAR
ncbi:biopolymer transporter ExbD [Pendulispora rubella]|uniref:Biopolymer transporter ExbD n=1 Tax=Pendulispora rubella TaxID=2741070 RepID=A0ABZ2LEE3_9BACT